MSVKNNHNLCGSNHLNFKHLFIFSLVLFSLLLVSAVSVNALEDQTTAYWTFDNSLSDATGNGYDLTNSGATYTASGKINGAYSFDGSNDYVYRNTFGFNENVFSISLWLYYRNGASGREAILSLDQPSVEYDNTIHIDDGLLKTYWASASNAYAKQNAVISGTTTIPEDTWTFITITKNGDTLKTYVNGVLSATLTGMGTYTFTENNLKIGTTEANYLLDGIIDEYSYFNNYVLTQDNITQLYNGGTGFRPSFDSYFVIINANDLNVDNFSINDCQAESISSNRWKLSCPVGNKEEQRAKIYKTLFYGTNGTNARVTTTYIDGLSELQTSMEQDVGKQAHYARHYSSTPAYPAKTYTGTFIDTTNNFNISTWSYVRAYSNTGKIAYSYWEMPSSTILNSAVGVDGANTIVDEIGTDTTRDEKNNSANCNLKLSGSEYWNVMQTDVRALILCYGDITWAASSDKSYYNVDFYSDHSVPLLTNVDFSITTNVDHYAVKMVSFNETLYFNPTSTYGITTVPWNDTRLWNITLGAPGYITKNYVNYNVSSEGNLESTLVAQDDVTDGLVSYYAYDDSLLDSLGRYNLTNVNTLNTNSGKINDARDFGGTNKYYTYLTNYQRGNTNSYNMWVKVANNGRQNQIFGTSNDLTPAYSGFFINKKTDDVLSLQLREVSAGTVININDGVTKSNNQWVMVTYIQNNNNHSFYINGNYIGSSLNTISSSSITENLYMGIHAQPPITTYAYAYEGYLDEVGIWNRTLTSGEITQLYNTGNGITYPFITNFSITTNLNEYTLTMVSNETKTFNAYNFYYETDIPYSDTRLWNITLSSPGYLVRSYVNYNISATGSIDTIFYDLKEDLTVYYNLDEGAGTTAIDSMDYVNGSINGSTYVLGKILNALSFSGGTNRIDIPTGKIDRTHSQSMSTSAWIKTSSNTKQFIFGHRTGNTLYFMNIEANLSLRYLVRDSAGTAGTLYCQDDLTDDTYYLVTGTYNATSNNLSIYVDGALCNSTTVNFAGNYVDDAVAFKIGTDEVNADSFNGIIDEVGIWYKPLSAYEVESLYNSGSGLTYPFRQSRIYDYGTSPATPFWHQNVSLYVRLLNEGYNISYCNFTAVQPNSSILFNNVNGTTTDGFTWYSSEFNITEFGLYEWNATCENTEGTRATIDTSFNVTNAPPQITNITITPLLPYANDTLVGECTAVDYEGDNITYSYNWQADGINVTLGLLNSTTLNLTGNYSVGQVITFECTVFDNTSYNDDSTSVTIQNLNLSIDNLSSDAVVNVTPQIGDIINFNADFESFMFDAEYCHVELKPVNSSTVFNTVEGTINGTSNGTVDVAFTITTAYTTAYKNVSYRAYCNDSQGNYGYSNYSYFTVVDSTEPEFNITGSEILINGTVRANVLVDELNIDVTFTDNNLFQASVNITCEEAGEIYYWEILDINTTSYNHNENFSVAGLDFQICNITLSASDDHTARIIPSYEYVELSNKLKYTTEHDLGITVTSSEEPRSVDTTKLRDRYIFDFEYDEPELTRTYSIETEEDIVGGAVAGEIFVRQSSEYPGHFVIWNDALKRGNWIDFAMENGDDYDYVVNKVSDTKYDVTISHKILAYPEEGMEFSEVKRDTIWSMILDFFTPEKALAYEDATYASVSRPIFMAKGQSLSIREVGEVTNRVVFDDEMLNDFKQKYGIKKVKFSSIGGTNINEMRTYFYIGGVFNISSYNKYDGAQFTNFTAQVEELTIPIAVANYTFLLGNSNYIDNVREGYYDFIFNHTQYINQSGEYNMTSQYDECIQYQANQSTVCGGLATGRYGFSNTADITNYSNIIDNNYSTYGYVDSIGLTYIYINYTVPANVSFAEWVVYAYNNITPNGTASVAIDAEGKTNLTLRMAARTGSGNSNLWLQEYNTTSAAWENLTYTPNGTYQSKIYEEHIVWYNQTENMVNVVYNTSQALITFNFYNVKSGLLLDNYTVYVIDDINNITKEFNVTDGSSGLTVPLNAEIEYEVLFVKDDYVNSTTFHTFSYKEISDVDIYVNYFATITLVDEDILEPFNISVPDKVELQIVCNGTTTTTILSSANEISETVNITDFFVPITCDYRKFKFVSTYSGSTFYRTLLIEYEDSVNQTVYLIDHANSAYVYTAFYIDDLLGLYDNPSIFIRKQIDTGTVTIHSDYTDIEGKVGAYLLENDEYVLEVHSDNRPDEVIGSYSADIGEEKIISLYDVELSSEATGFSQNVRYTINLQNVSNATSIVFAYFDGEDKTTSIQFRVFENRYNDTLLYTSPLYTNTSQFGHLVWDITGYENSTLVGELIIQHEVEGEVRIARTVKKEWSLALPLMDYVSQEFMNWFFTITLSIVAIMASANMSFATLAIIGLAVLFVLFGWYGLSFTALGFALLVALIEMWAKRGK